MYVMGCICLEESCADAPMAMEVCQEPQYSRTAEAGPPWATYKMLFTKANVPAFVHLYGLSVVRPDALQLSLPLVSQIAELIVEDVHNIAAIPKECEALHSSDQQTRLAAVDTLSSRFRHREDGCHCDQIATCLTARNVIPRLLNLLTTRGGGGSVVTELLMHVVRTKRATNVCVENKGLDVLAKVVKRADQKAQGHILRIVGCISLKGCRNKESVRKKEWHRRAAKAFVEPFQATEDVMNLDAAIAFLLQKTLEPHENDRGTIDSLKIIRVCTPLCVKLLQRQRHSGGTQKCALRALCAIANVPEMTHILNTVSIATILSNVLASNDDDAGTKSTAMILCQLLLLGVNHNILEILQPARGIWKHLHTSATSPNLAEAHAAQYTIQIMLVDEIGDAKRSLLNDGVALTLLRAFCDDANDHDIKEWNTTALTCLAAICRLEDKGYTLALFTERLKLLPPLCTMLRKVFADSDGLEESEEIIEVLYAIWEREKALPTAAAGKGQTWLHLCMGGTLGPVLQMSNHPTVSEGIRSYCEKLLVPQHFS